MSSSTWSLFACLAFAGCAAESTSIGEIESRVTTTGDTDLASDCAGVLTFVNTASFATLDAYLPSNVAHGLVARRATAPFVSIADVSSVSGVADARLRQIGEAARAQGAIGASCAGVIQELAVSADDAAAMLSFANTASVDDLIDALRASNAEDIGPQLVAARPYDTLNKLAAQPGVGPASFRGLRDAAVIGPFDQLVTAVNATPAEVTLRTGFDPIEALYPQAYGQRSAPICFGMPADLVAQAGGSLRPNLATGSEVYDAVTNAIAVSGYTGSATAAGLADLAAHTSGQTFYGCVDIGYEPNPWCGTNRSFFVNTLTGYRMFVETGWCE